MKVDQEFVRIETWHLNVFFMKYLDPAELVLFPAIISVRADTANILREMANEMGVSLDEVLSALAEDSVSQLSPNTDFLDDVFIPDRCSTQDLLDSIE